MCSISPRSSSFVLPSLFWRRPRSSSSLPSAKTRSSSVSWPYFCFSLPLIAFQLPFICSFMTDNSCMRPPSVFPVVELMPLKINKKTTRLYCLRVAKQKGALETNETKLIFVHDDAIDHHSVASPGVMDSDGNTHFNPCFHDVFIQYLTAARHINNLIAEAIMPRTAGFLKHNRAARSVLGDRPAGVCCGRCCGGL